MEEITEVTDKIIDRIKQSEGWTSPDWLDDIKEEFPTCKEEEIDNICVRKLKRNSDPYSPEEVTRLYKEQISLTSANQKYLLQNLTEETLELKD